MRVFKVKIKDQVYGTYKTLEQARDLRDMLSQWSFGQLSILVTEEEDE